MKIKELCEDAADDIELALVHHADHKRKEHEHLHTGSKFKKSFYKGKIATDKLTKHNDVIHTINKVHDWVKKHSK